MCPIECIVYSDAFLSRDRLVVACWLSVLVHRSVISRSMTCGWVRISMCPCPCGAVVACSPLCCSIDIDEVFRATHKNAESHHQLVCCIISFYCCCYAWNQLVRPSPKWWSTSADRSDFTVSSHIPSMHLCIFGHVARLDDVTPTNMALQLHINTSLNWPPDRMWRRPRNKWLDFLLHCST